MSSPVTTKPAPRVALTQGVVALLAAVLLFGAWCCDFGRKSGISARVADAARGPAVLSNVSFRDQSGAVLTSAAFAGKIVVLHFMFTSCPAVCPLQTRELARVQRAIPESLKSRVLFVSVSVDPERDTPEALHRFASVNGIELGSWSLLTASPAATQKLARDLGAIEPSTASALPAAHGTSIYLFDSRGRLLQRYAAKPLDRQRLVRELEAIDRIETGDGRTAAL